MAQVRKGGKPTLAEQPNPIDLLVSKRIRQRRNVVRVSQQHVADRIGVSRNQYVKYESGANRVSAGQLYEIARVLQVDLNYFFDARAAEVETVETMPDDERKFIDAYRSLAADVKPRARRILRALAE